MKGTLLAVVLVSTLAIFPATVSSTQTYGPREDYLHIINYGDPNTEFAALEAGSIDLIDWPLSAYWINKWVGEGRIPSEITLTAYVAIDAFEYDIHNQKWPTGCDGVAAREGYTGTYTRGAYTWNQFHTRQRPDKGDYLTDHPPTYDPGTQTTPMGDGADYDPETDSWKTYFDEDCLWCTMAWGLRLAMAYLTDKDYVVSTILEGLGQKMIAWAAAPAQTGWLDIANLTSSSFVYHGPHADVTISSLIFGHGMTRAQMDAKADELLDAAGFIKYGGNTWRSDPRKVAGADKLYGTGDDVTGAATQMDDLMFYIRLDDPMREAAGLKLAADLETHDIPVSTFDAEKPVCFNKVKVEYYYHLYTGGWVLGPEADYLYHLFHSSMYWYPMGWSPNYPGFCHGLFDEHADDVKSSGDYLTIVAGAHNATFLINKYVASIPLWSTTSAKAFRTGWDGTIGMSGEGTDNYWSFFNMKKDGTDTINWGFKSSPETLNVITAEWMWDRKVLGLIYEGLIIRNPYDLSEDRGMLATSWSTGTWDGDKIYVDFNLKDGVKWHDGTLFTAEDVKWALEFIRDCGFGVAWTHPVENGGTYLETGNLKDLHNVAVTASGAGGSVRVYFNSSSYWAMHWAGFPFLPSRKIWMNASAYYGWGYDPSKPPGVGAGLRWPDDSARMAVRNYHIYNDDIYDPTSATPNSDGIVDLMQDGTGPWEFVGYTGPIDDVECIDLEAFRDHHLSQSQVETYLNEAFHLLGNVNYPGSVHESDYITAGIGVDRDIDISDLVLLNKAYLTTSADPPGIDWGEWNEDADLNNDNTVDDFDVAIAQFNFGRSADTGGGLRNVAILDVVTSQTVVLQGSSVSINVTVENQGGTTETFDVTTYYDSVAIKTKEVSGLVSDANTTLTFTWNTTGVSLGDYVISAVATPVQGELYTADNTYTDGTIYIYTPIVQSSVRVGATDYPISIETNVTITDVVAKKNSLRFETSGPTGLTGYINTTIPVGLNKTRIKVFLDGAQVTPPPFPIITTNGTHYFVYFEFTFSTHDIIIQYAIVDMAVTNVEPSQTVILQGNVMSINVTIENQGNYTETFNVTAYANTTTIATLANITLTSGNSTTITFAWNTTDWGKGAYTISANASHVPGEIETADNSKEADSAVTVLSHDVAIKDFTPSKTIVCQGYNVAINVTVENQGSYTETFNVTVHANTTVIATLTNITLTSENSSAIAFTWNTTGVAKGIYSITVNATTVLGELDIVDNLYVDGTVRVNMVGDVAPEFEIVDIVDIVYVAIHFGAEKGKPPPPNAQPYEANADINGDGIIDIVDIVTVAIHFGETDP